MTTRVANPIAGDTRLTVRVRRARLRQAGPAGTCNGPDGAHPRTASTNPHADPIPTVNQAVEHTGVLERLARGDASALQETMSTYGGLVWSLALRFCRERADAEDAVQEIFTDIWKSAHRFDAGRASERVFISMIARRRLIDRLRRERRRGEVEAQVASEPGTERQQPGDAGERGWDAERATRAIDRLSPDQQRVLRMGVIQGMTQSEIAAAAGMPLGTVKTHMRRGLIRLRELIASAAADHGDPGP